MSERVIHSPVLDFGRDGSRCGRRSLRFASFGPHEYDDRQPSFVDRPDRVLGKQTDVEHGIAFGEGFRRLCVPVDREKQDNRSRTLDAIRYQRLLAAIERNPGP